MVKQLVGDETNLTKILKDFRFLPVPEPIAACSDLNSTEKLLYGLLCKYIGKNGYCWPKQDTLARGMGMKVLSVKRMLKRLESGGFIKRNVVTKGFQKTTRYRLLYHPVFDNFDEIRDGPPGIIEDTLDKIRDTSNDTSPGIVEDTLRGIVEDTQRSILDDTRVREQDKDNKEQDNSSKKTLSKERVSGKPDSSKKPPVETNNNLAETAKRRSSVRERLEDKDNQFVVEIISYWNSRESLKALKTQSKTKALQRTYEQIKLRFDQGYDVAEITSFIDWFDQNRNQSTSRLFKNHRTGGWYNFPLHEILLFSKSQIKSNRNRKGIASTLEGIPSLFEAFIMGNTSCFDFGPKVVDGFLVDSIRKGWEDYQDGYCSSVPWERYTNGPDKIYERIAHQVDRFCDKYKHHFNLLGSYQAPAPGEVVCRPFKVVIFMFQCVKHSSKLYELHWLASDNFFFSILPNYLTENGYVVDTQMQSFYEEDLTVQDVKDYEDLDPIISQASSEHDEYLDSLFDPIFYKAKATNDL